MAVKKGGKRPARQQRTYTFIDLFAGIGGTRIAFERTGCRCIFSSEWDRWSQQTYAANFGHTPAGDITKIDASEIPDHDILLAGFPCQPFSISGVSKKNALGRAHGFADETQGTLFFEIIRILKEKRPIAFLLENVKNLTSHDRGRTFRVIMRTLENELGYSVEPGIIDAKSVVPQHRERIFLAGFREWVPFEFPEIPDKKPKLKNILEPWVDRKYTLTPHLWQYLRDYADKHKAMGNGFGYGLADLNGITRTLSARYYKDGSEILVPQKNGTPRRLTPRECARLMGFPDTFRIPVSDTQAYKQFGNSVVVPVVEAIAREMVRILRNDEKSRHPIDGASRGDNEDTGLQTTFTDVV